jgi:hypothetical protein
VSESVAGTAAVPQSIRWHRGWRFLLGAIFLCCAATSFGYFATYPLFRSAIGGLAQFALGLFTFLAPVFFVAALLAPSQQWIAAAKAHAAAYIAFMVVLTITFEGGHSSPGDAFVDLVFAVLLAILAIELIVLLIAVERSPPAAREVDGAPWFFTALVCALLGGWAIGVLLWSETVPARIMAAAESAAGEVPYCLIVDGRVASRSRDLTGLSAHSASSSGYHWNFHAVLVTETGPTKAYWNWSYKTGRFEKLSERASSGSLLESIAKCQPVSHFARRL